MVIIFSPRRINSRGNRVISGSLMPLLKMILYRKMPYCQQPGEALTQQQNSYVFSSDSETFSVSRHECLRCLIECIPRQNDARISLKAISPYLVDDTENGDTPSSAEEISSFYEYFSKSPQVLGKFRLMRIASIPFECYKFTLIKAKYRPPLDFPRRDELPHTFINC